MRAISIAVASAAALLSVSAYAQAPKPVGAVSSPHSTMSAAVKVNTPNPLQQADVSKINGTAVYGSNNKQIGSVTTELMKPRSHKINRLVVHTGGVLGFGGRDVALPLKSFAWDSAKGAFTISKTAKQLKAMAAWRSSASATTAAAGSSLPAKGSSAPSGAGH